MTGIRVAVTGAGGRLGRALVNALRSSPVVGPERTIAWSRPVYDLDDFGAPSRLVDRDRPTVVVHAAAWTDVDAAARDRRLAYQRNEHATGELATTCAGAGVGFVYISTNEVFDGTRTDGRGYRPEDAPNPINTYGSSKLGGEVSAAASFEHGIPLTAIIRTSWLYGPPGHDFPMKIVAAGARARAAHEPLRVVGDEFGSPTSAADLAAAVVAVIESGVVGRTYHFVNAGAVSRAGWAREVFRLADLDVAIVEVPASTWSRASTPPRWGVLEPSHVPGGTTMRPWADALADYGPDLRREASMLVATGSSAS